jgi:hypothetical protein
MINFATGCSCENSFTLRGKAPPRYLLHRWPQSRSGYYVEKENTFLLPVNEHQTPRRAASSPVIILIEDISWLFICNERRRVMV